jgi:hypothetical protein
MGTPVPHPTSRAFLAFKIRCVCAGPGRLAEYDRSSSRLLSTNHCRCAAARDSDLFGLTLDGVVACGREARGPTP